jgi:hypothetical protein
MPWRSAEDRSSFAEFRIAHPPARYARIVDRDSFTFVRGPIGEIGIDKEMEQHSL